MSACAAPSAEPANPSEGPSAGTAEPVSPASSSPPSTPETVPSPSPSAAAEQLPRYEELRARFEGRQPSQWGLDVTGVVSTSSSEAICLTFDACGGPHGSGYDQALISALREHQVPATLFINAHWIDANPGITQELIDDPLFEIANHGWVHKPLSVTGAEAYGIPGTTSLQEAYDEVAKNQEKLAELTGSLPRWFRSGTAHVDEVAVELAEALGVKVVNFDINSDAGATYPAETVAAETQAAGPGSICIGHFNKPGSGTAAGIATAIDALLAKGARFATLSDALS